MYVTIILKIQSSVVVTFRKNDFAKNEDLSNNKYAQITNPTYYMNVLLLSLQLR